MKEKIYNYDNLKESTINDKVVRVKALIINSKNEILLGEAFGTIQFPGGHLEVNETLNNGLKREILEETGIILNEDYKPFFAIKYFLKDYPVIGNNRSIEIYYFYIKTDEEYNLSNIYLDDQERTGEFKLKYVPLNSVKKVLKANINKNKINHVVTSEMLLALKMLKKQERKNRWKVKNLKC